MKTTLAALGLTSLFAIPATVHATVIITPADGFALTWDGNDGVGFNAADPAPAPASLANAPGAVAFTSSDLGLGVHIASHVNDGLYGNSNSWIGGDGTPNPYAAIRLTTLSTVTSIAFGRDNGNSVSDACGGQCADRSLGLYVLQYTSVATPDGTTANTGDATTGWQSIGTFNYTANVDTVPGEGFTSFFRHEYGLGAGVQATGLRLLVPGTGIGPEGTAIDEFEIYGTPVPEPTAAFGVLGGLGALLLRRRRA